MQIWPRFIITILVMAAFPVLMFVFPSEQNIIRLWGAAMLILSFTAGREVSGALSRRGAFAWLIGDVVLLTVLALSGVLGLRSAASLPHKMGLLASVIVGLGLPAAALQATIVEERRKQ